MMPSKVRAQWVHLRVFGVLRACFERHHGRSKDIVRIRLKLKLVSRLQKHVKDYACH